MIRVFLPPASSVYQRKIAKCVFERYAEGKFDPLQGRLPGPIGDLIRRMIAINPATRPSAKECLYEFSKAHKQVQSEEPQLPWPSTYFNLSMHVFVASDSGLCCG